MLEIKDITKRFGTKVALNHISMELSEGIYGVLGANGAGKSTLMNLITDNVSRESGEILYKGKDILTLGAKFRAKIGYMPQQQGFYENLSARAFLMYMSELKGIKRKLAKAQISELLDVVNLTDVADKKVGGFSGGMKQRVLLAQALLGYPEILILDEPTAGLDPKERVRLRSFIEELSKDKIIIFATHVVSDIETIANQVLIIKKGELVAMADPKTLIEKVDGKNLEDVYMYYNETD